MRKIITMVILVATLAGCSGKKQESKNPVETKASTTGSMIAVNRSEFLTKIADFEKSQKEWKYLGNKPAIVDFYADWCGPCKMMTPILTEIAAEYANQIYVYKVDIDKEPEIAAAFGIQSIPTLLLIPLDGAPQTIQGAAPKSALNSAINNFLLKN